MAVYLHELKHRVSVVNPTRIKAFAQSELLRTKTDAVDATLIARFCRSQAPEAWIPPAPEIRILQALMRHYEHLKTTRAQQSVYAPAGTCDGGRPHTVRDDERWRIGISVPRAMRDGLCVNTLRAPYVHDIPYHLNERSGWFPQTGVNIHNGSLYGTTYYEGRRIKHGGGTVFKLTP